MTDWGNTNRWRFGDQGGFIALLNGLYMGYIGEYVDNNNNSNNSPKTETENEKQRRIIDNKPVSMTDYFNTFQYCNCTTIFNK